MAQPSVFRPSPALRASVALVLAMLASIGAGIALLRSPASTTDAPSGRPGGVPGLLERLERTKKLHVGYGVYPPYTQENPSTRRVTGFSVDLIEQIAKELDCDVVWHRLNWNTMSADLKRGTYDVIADPIFRTIPRAREFAFTDPYAYFADGIAVVNADESRFTDFDSLDRDGVRIAVGQGWATETLLKARFSHARIIPVQTSTDLLQLFNEVLAGRADVAVADAADAERFVREHSGRVRALFLESPPAWVPAGFALRPDDRAGAEFLSVSLRVLQTSGFIDALARRYQVVVRSPNHDR